MNNPRIPVVIMVVSLVAVAIIAARTFERSINAKDLRQTNIAGMADLNRVVSSGPDITGFADLNRVEARGPRFTGFADLNRVDPVGKVATNAAASQPQQITGFADLNRVEAQAGLPQTGGNPAQSSEKVCPRQSTPGGERDAGASAPAYVLKAMGCPSSDGE